METVQSILETKGSDVATIDRDATVGEAADLMTTRKIGALVVTDGEKVVGIFTERDILGRVVARQRVPDETKVGGVMTSPTACCRWDTPIQECRTVMTDQGIRHLPVVEDGRLHGLISTRDIITVEVAAKEGTIECLQSTIDHLNEYLYSRT